MPLQRLTGTTDSATDPVVRVVTTADPTVLHIVEPVLVDPSDAEISLDDLVDVRVPAGLPAGVMLVLRRDDDGVLTLDPMDEQALRGVGYRHVQWIAASRWQIRHDMAFDPAGVVVRDTAGVLTEPGNITYPMPGVVELVFGAPVAGTAWLS